MKKILALMLTLCLLAVSVVACGPKDEPDTESKYTLAIVIDNAVSGVKISNTVCAVIADADGKIVSVRFDASDAEFSYDDELVVPTNIESKVENYPEMNGKNWEGHANAFADYVVGMTAEQVKAVDLTLVTGCTMPYTTPLLKSLVVEALESDRKVEFTSSVKPTLGVGMTTSAAGELGASAEVVTVDAGAVAVVNGAIVASVLDTAVREGTFTYEDEELVFTSAEYAGSKAEKGENYKMPAGSWYKQAAGFCSQTIGLTKDTIKDLAVTGDAMTAAGCTMQWTVYGYKTVLTKALNKA